MICRLEACNSRALDNFVMTLFQSNPSSDLIIAGRTSRRDIIRTFGITGRDTYRVWDFSTSTLHRLCSAVEHHRRRDPVIVLHEDQLDEQERAYLDGHARWLDIFCISRANQLRMGWVIHEEIGVSVINDRAIAQIRVDGSPETPAPPRKRKKVAKRKKKKARSNRSRFDVLELEES